MGQDYSYSQPSSSEDYDYIESLLEAEASLYADEAESSRNIAEPFQKQLREELTDFQKQLREVKDQRYACDQKLVKLEETVRKLAKKNSRIRDALPLVVCVMVSVLFVICMVVMFKLEELQRLRRRWSESV